MRRRINLKLWRLVSAILIPILMLPVALHEKTTVRCLYVLLLMAFYWMFSLTPEAITALLPIALLPLLNILSTKDVCTLYTEQSVMTMLSSLIMAKAIEESKIHQRIALKMLFYLRTSIYKVLLGLMLTTMFLSFCISGAAATAVLIPVTDVIVNELNQQFNKNEKQNKFIRKELVTNLTNRSPNRSPKSVFRYDFSNSNQNSFNNSLNSSFDTAGTSGGGMQLAVVLTNSSNRLGSSRTSTEFKNVIIDEDNRFEDIKSIRKPIEPKSMTKSQRAIRLAFFFSLAYSANIGGTGTLTASNPNLILQAFMQKTYPEAKVLSFATWLIYAFPCALVMIIVAWIFVLVYFLRNISPKVNQTRHLEECLISKYEKLGPIKFHEIGVAIFFVLIVLLWFFRSPGFMLGWQDWLGDYFKYEDQMISDATPAFLLLILMSLVPIDFDQFRDDRKTNHRFRQKKFEFLLNWNNVIKNLPWNVILLFGGGLALAEGTIKSGLSSLFTRQLVKLNIKSPKLFIVILTIFCAYFTEIVSNSAITAILLPVVNQEAIALKINPLFFLLPMTVSASFAFMLPSASPCNAIVYEHLGIDILHGLLPGAIMNLICGILEFILIITYGKLVFNFSTDSDQFPKWAMKHLNDSLNSNSSLLIYRTELTNFE